MSGGRVVALPIPVGGPFRASLPQALLQVQACTWYVEVGRVQHALGKHPPGLPEPRKGPGGWEPPPEIRRAFYRTMTELVAKPDKPDKPDAECPNAPSSPTSSTNSSAGLPARRGGQQGAPDPRLVRWLPGIVP